MTNKEKLEELRRLDAEISMKKAAILSKTKKLREGEIPECPECHKEDLVNHPSHYETGKFECIEVMEEIYGREDVKAFCRCNAFKYLYRCKNKNGNQDIDKARWYINKYLELCKEDGDDPDYPSILHDVMKAYKKYDEEKVLGRAEFVESSDSGVIARIIPKDDATKEYLNKTFGFNGPGPSLSMEIAEEAGDGNDI